MDAAVRDGSTLLTDVYRQTGDPAALELLDRFVIDQQRRLDALLDRLAGIDPALRDQAEATADLLASLHARSPRSPDPRSRRHAEDAGAARDPSSVSGDPQQPRAGRRARGRHGVLPVCGRRTMRRPTRAAPATACSSERQRRRSPRAAHGLVTPPDVGTTAHHRACPPCPIRSRQWRPWCRRRGRGGAGQCRCVPVAPSPPVLTSRRF